MKMISGGLVSVSFRKLNSSEIIELLKRSVLKAIEWGGDVHVPHGNYPEAKKVRTLCKDANIIIGSYGSYYMAGESESEGLSFASVLNTAIELNTSNIRIWAGKKGSNDADIEYRKIVTDDLNRVGELAAKQNITVSLEFHTKTLTDTNESTFKLLEEVSHPNIYYYWQPPIGKSVEYCLEGLNKLLPRITNIHVFYWTGNYDSFVRHHLQEGTDIWKNYLDVIKGDKKDRFAFLEFVKDDDPEQLIKDSGTLSGWLR
jgi:3-dehydroshikimate dehydratase